MTDFEIPLVPVVEGHNYHLFSNPRLERLIEELARENVASPDTINRIRQVLSSREAEGIFICDDGIVHYLDTTPDIEPE